MSRPSVVSIVTFMLCIGIFIYLSLKEADANQAYSDDNWHKVCAVAERLTIHYIHNMPQRPKTNDEMIFEYTRAFKSFEKAVYECNEDNYDILPLKKEAVANKDTP